MSVCFFYKTVASIPVSQLKVTRFYYPFCFIYQSCELPTRAWYDGRISPMILCLVPGSSIGNILGQGKDPPNHTVKIC